ncbi:MAG TPA: AgmX/PglI C-terminal domain-containing protein, partial [Polyangia bacterium]
VGVLGGDEVGEAYGAGGLGLSGTGLGGGGADDGTIGLGDLGTIGHGGGSGSGVGYGSGAGGLGGRRAATPVCTLGRAEVRGSCDADLIRRVMRAHGNELRFCYERVLQSHPTLTGRSVTRFVIGVDGRVAASSASGFPEVDACVAAAIRRWEFSRYCAASIRWPLVFVPLDDGAVASATGSAP